MFQNQQNLYSKIPPTAILELLQYNGSRVEHKDGFSSYKMICSDGQNGEFGLDFKVLVKTGGV